MVETQKINKENIKLADWTYKVEENEIRKLLRVKPKYYFAGGKPGNLPVKVFSEILFEISEKIKETQDSNGIGGSSILNYGTSEGIPELRNILAQRMIKRENISLDKENGWQNILITTGSQQILFSIVMTILNHNDVVFVPRPSYLGFLGPLNVFGATIISLPIDSEGIIPEGLRNACEICLNVLKKNPKLLYITSFADNPTGISYSQKRKKELFDLAEEYNFFILEDNAYKEITFKDSITQPLKALDKENKRVIYTCTTSKEAAVLRIGYSIIPPIFNSQLIKIKGFLDLCTPVLTQEIAYHYYRDHIDNALPLIIKNYKKQNQAMKKAIDENLEGTRSDPSGGFFIWQKFDENFNSSEFLSYAIQNDVIYVSGSGFYNEQGYAISNDCSELIPNFKKFNEIRLSYSNSDVDTINAGIEKLGKIYSIYK